ncbi:enoyl-CoA hydratase/isomerase family protein [Pusillimonas caeni]|uniref:enoyl-CoA hydratase/isomerase family protein n=1 Tax=Pusillimonas caeni TaxID=1348472 RepID=UPI001FD780FD|nr:enoyl-CoA hydratase/isomerase family protein [Pusillimonas caeni]
MLDLVRVQSEQSITRVTLCRAEKGNSLSSEMVAALTAIVRRCYEDGTTLLVLAGDGRHFCTGFDLGELDQETDDTLMARFVRIELLLQALNAAPFITAALGQGRIVGAGADIFAACKRRILIGDARLRFPGAAFGLVLGTGRLARIVGVDKACEWVGSGRWIARDEASAAGLCTACLDEAGVFPFVEELANESVRLDAATRSGVYAAAGAGRHSAEDLEALVLSAARPGLRDRIQAFRDAAVQK